MDFGIHNPSWLYGREPDEIFDAFQKKAQWAEAAGFTWFSVMDHLIQIPGVGAPTEPFLEGWTTLAALAAVTQKIRLATLVSSASYRNPALLAKIATTIDLISKGRLIFGVGAGWFTDEHNQYGYDFLERPAQRIARLEETLRIVLAMWTQERATFTGKYYHIQDAILEPKPVQKPHPPVMIGGSGEQLTLRLVARLGNMCNLFGNPDEVRHKLEVLQKHCETEGRDFNEIVRSSLTALVLAKSEAELKAKKERLAVPDPFRGYALTASQAVDLVGAYQKVGVQLFITSIWKNDPESLELLASEVMPKFS
ncbi:MAG: LLM class F420-dependent oxidoreductase [Chloroflexi bacterium]|nr:LLM class F420-dependent oxidoreductase [Chloroflexota bacterium]